MIARRTWIFCAETEVRINLLKWSYKIDVDRSHRRTRCGIDRRQEPRARAHSFRLLLLWNYYIVIHKLLLRSVRTSSGFDALEREADRHKKPASIRSTWAAFGLSESIRRMEEWKIGRTNERGLWMCQDSMVIRHTCLVFHSNGIPLGREVFGLGVRRKFFGWISSDDGLHFITDCIWFGIEFEPIYGSGKVKSWQINMDLFVPDLTTIGAAFPST